MRIGKVKIDIEPDEEILYKAEKPKAYIFWVLVVVCIAAAAFFAIGLNSIQESSEMMESVGGLAYIVLAIFLFIVVICAIIDYVLTAALITNKRFIMVISGIVTSLEFSQVKKIFDKRNTNEPEVTVESKSGDKYNLDYINMHKLKAKFKEIYPEYSDTSCSE